jgi:hypothetical protein
MIKRTFWFLATVSAMLVTADSASKAIGYATYFARVSATATVLNSSGVSEAVQASTGVYSISFNRNVNYCGWIAGVNGPTSGYATTTLADPRTITVRTFAADGAVANRAFTVFVQCACNENALSC